MMMMTAAAAVMMMTAAAAMMMMTAAAAVPVMRVTFTRPRGKPNQMNNEMQGHDVTQCDEM